MASVQQKVGKYGEDVAARYLLDAGYVIIDRNWRCAEGEIDIIARHEGTLVFCEVKTRRSDVCGTGLEAIHRTKVRTIRKVAAGWLAAAQLPPVPVRFDVLSVVPQRSGAAKVEHVVSAF